MAVPSTLPPRRRLRLVTAMLAAATAVLAGTAGQPAEAEVQVTQTPGVDVSNFQGTVNFRRVKASGRAFAIVLATDGTSFTSPDFRSQYRGAKAAGLVRGAYHFARPGRSSAASQANRFLDVVGGTRDGVTLPPVVDLEFNPNGSACYGLSARQTVAWVKAFLARVKARTGRNAIIYTGPGYWNQCAAGSRAFSASHPLWTADYGVSAPHRYGGWSFYTIWQHTSSGSVPGISGRVDLDRFNGSRARLRALARS